MRVLLHNPQLLVRRLPLCSSNEAALMGSRQLLKTSSPFALVPLNHNYRSEKHRSGICRRMVRVLASQPISNNHHFRLKTNGFSSIASPTVASPVYSEGLEERRLPVSHSEVHLDILKWKLNKLGFDMDICTPGKQHSGLLCPVCKGGDSEEKSLSLVISPDGASASWICFRGKCGWTGNTRALADGKSSFASQSKINSPKVKRKITVEGLGLEPLSDQLLGYFAERMISKETLHRNAVMQKRYGGKGAEFAIAFTYWRKGELVNCKYRDVTKRFWQERETETIFYGLDDIEEASDIIIVEGEMDKLAMEEAGFRNCVSVPDGAPPSVSANELPTEEKDTKYQYLWNCKEYLKTASRIILATDGDQPGQALAEELARRVGRERCWRVKWPKKKR